MKGSSFPALLSEFFGNLGARRERDKVREEGGRGLWNAHFSKIANASGCRRLKGEKESASASKSEIKGTFSSPKTAI